jgi:hypothetical protein
MQCSRLHCVCCTSHPLGMKLTKAARAIVARRTERLVAKHGVEQGIAAGSALVAAGAAAAIDKRFGDPVTGIFRMPGPVPVPVFGVTALVGIGVCLAFEEFPGREAVGGAAVGLACEQITLFTHRETPRPEPLQPST